ncbi:MAG TPA: histidine kinase dimerization/phosphoacceptor domain -containing protein [Rectinemataceae bacterium]|nr:histidine kinase dimerization/phosphoacceptor domain -containing protein [Rectinemataceae bacterium]
MENEKPFTAVSATDSGGTDRDDALRNSARIGESFKNLVKALPDIVYVLDPSGHFVYLNEAVRSLGYEPESLVGRHFTEIIHEDDRLDVSRDAVLAKIRTQEAFPETPPKLFDERRSGQRMTRELEVRLLSGKNREIVYASVNAYGEPVADPVLYSLFKTEGPITMGVIHDITAARLYQKSLEENLASKEILLKEIHHRVRDNLQVISSLAHLREMDVHEESAKRSLAELIVQIKSISIVHEALYRAENVSGVSAREYFEHFARLMVQSYGHIGSPIALKVAAEDCLLDAGRLSYMAMIASEFVSNAYQHAFPDGRPGEITISYGSFPDRDELSVVDDGVGLPPDMDARSGLGTEIAEALAKQLGGRIEKGFGRGTSMKLIMPVPG